MSDVHSAELQVMCDAMAAMMTAGFAGSLPPTSNPAVLHVEISRSSEIEALRDALRVPGGWELLQQLIQKMLDDEFVVGARFPHTELLMAIAAIATELDHPIADAYVLTLADMRHTVEFGDAGRFAAHVHLQRLQ